MEKKICIVDDDPTVITLVEAILKKQGFAVSSASDGLDALVKIKKERPDLVILDIMMPEINGYDVCYQLRFNKEFDKIPIILLTSREQELDGELGKRSGIEYLRKPVNSQLLLETIAGLLAA